MRLATLGLGVVVIGLLAGCDPAMREPLAQVAAPQTVSLDQAAEAPHEQGRRIYNFRCYYCHGYSGDARTLAARFVDPKPRDFSALDLAGVSRDSMLRSVMHGLPGTAMTGFGQTLSASEIERVVDFVIEEFVRRKAVNTRYHTAGNGWPDHERYRAAFPFATGEIPLDRPWSELDATQVAGKRLYMASCVSCHDRSNVTDAGPPWQLRGVSYPPGNYEESDDHHPPAQSAGAAMAAAAPSPHASDGHAPIDPYELHEDPPKLVGASRQVARGERVFQSNCAHCHAADGTGRNWIGSFLEPQPADFTEPAVARRLLRDRVAAVTRNGIPASSMPAWNAVLGARDIEAVAAYVEHVFVKQAGLDVVRAGLPAARHRLP